MLEEPWLRDSGQGWHPECAVYPRTLRRVRQRALRVIESATSRSNRPEAKECPAAAMIRLRASARLVNLLLDVAVSERLRAAPLVLSSLLYPFPCPTAPI